MNTEGRQQTQYVHNKLLKESSKQVASQPLSFRSSNVPTGLLGECGRITLKFIGRANKSGKQTRNEMESGYLLISILEFTLVFFYFIISFYYYYFLIFLQTLVSMAWLSIEFHRITLKLYSLNMIGRMGSCLGRKVLVSLLTLKHKIS